MCTLALAQSLPCVTALRSACAVLVPGFLPTWQALVDPELLLPTSLNMALTPPPSCRRVAFGSMYQTQCYPLRLAMCPDTLRTSWMFRAMMTSFKLFALVPCLPREESWRLLTWALPAPLLRLLSPTCSDLLSPRTCGWKWRAREMRCQRRATKVPLNGFCEAVGWVGWVERSARGLGCFKGRPMADEGCMGRYPRPLDQVHGRRLGRLSSLSFAEPSPVGIPVVGARR